MSHRDHHSALKTNVIAEITEGGVHYKHVRLQHGKDSFVDTLHARPNSWTSAGIQITDFLHYLGFHRSGCPFHSGECFCREIDADCDIQGLAKAVSGSFQKFQNAARELEHCGLYIDQPEGWGFFHGKPSSSRSFRSHRPRGDGHVAPKSERMKESEDEFFRYTFTWIDGAGDKGWTTHYRAKHMPLSPEFQSALDFLGGFSWFQECPEFDFEGCWWRFTPFEDDERSAFSRSAEHAHGAFDAHAQHFSSGLQHLLLAHAEVELHGLSFLSVRIPQPVRPNSVVSAHTGVPTKTDPRSAVPREFDLAISFAGTERPLAEELATRMRDAGFDVFYDGFYPEQLWGKDLAAYFDRVYRKESRYCVMFVSREYADRMWTTHERRSAQARAVTEKGREYILPIKVDDTDLDGLPPSVGYVSLTDYPMEQIAELLVKKLKIDS